MRFAGFISDHSLDVPRDALQVAARLDHVGARHQKKGAGGAQRGVQRSVAAAAAAAAVAAAIAYAEEA